MSKIEDRFTNEGRALFDSEKPIVDDFNEKYKEQLKVREMEAVVGSRKNPFPRRFDPTSAAVQAAITKERQAVIDFLLESGQRALADYITAGLHHVF